MTLDLNALAPRTHGPRFHYWKMSDGTTIVCVCGSAKHFKVIHITWFGIIYVRHYTLYEYRTCDEYRAHSRSVPGIS